MKCPKCQFENPEAMKFCDECGTKLELICPKCSFPNPPGFKFCGECGQKLEAPSKEIPKPLSPEEKIEKIQQYLPKGIAEKRLGQRGRNENERKQGRVASRPIASSTGKQIDLSGVCDHHPLCSFV